MPRAFTQLLHAVQGAQKKLAGQLGDRKGSTEPQCCHTLDSGGTSVLHRHARVTPLASCAVQYVEGAAYDELRLADSSVAVTHNSVVLIPDLLSKTECEMLVRDVESVHATRPVPLELP